MRIKDLIKGIFLLLSFNINAQFSNLKFENFDTSKGLSSSTCVEIFQDKEGFLWFGTIDGLNKYNGYEFEIFRPIVNDKCSISNNRINAITEDHLGYLWIGTSNGLNVFDKKAQRFYKINLDKNFIDKTNPREEINCLKFDVQKKILWIGTKNGLIKIDLSIFPDDFQSFRSIRYKANSKNNNALDNNNISNLILDKKGQLWIGTAGNNLHKYNSKANVFERQNINFEANQFLDHLPKQIILDNKNEFWIGNDLGHLYVYNSTTKQHKKVSQDSFSVPIFHLYQDIKGLIWVATDGEGLYLLDKQKGLIKHLVQNPDDPFSLPNNQPSKVLQDKEGTYWIATYNKGVSKLALFKSSFGHHFYKTQTSNSLSTKIAQSVFQDSRQRIWIGTDGGGLDMYDDTKETYKHYKNIPGNLNSLSSNKILYVIEGNNDELWVCTWDRGLNKFNTETGQVKRFLNDPNNVFSIGQNTVWCAAKDKQERLWLGTSLAGLNLFDTQTERFYQFKNSPNSPKSIISNFVFSLFVDSKNRLWVGTSIGLCFVNLDKLDARIPKKIQFEEIKIKNVQGNRVNQVIEDYKGNIWIGTDMGLFQLDKHLQLRKSYSSSSGLPNNLVVGLQEDNNKNIWISTKSGLSLLSPKSGKIINFNVHDGLQGLEFQSKSIAKTFDGRIIAGGINGFNLFNPNDIVLNSDKVKPIFSGIKLFNQKVNAGDTINNRVLFENDLNSLDKLKLAYNEGHISISFVALNYQNPERVKYAYKMSGLDKEYINADNNRIANYANLPPGSYTFEVMAAVDGQWENAGKTSIEIDVSPPFWKSWWAYIFYMIAGAAMIWFGLKYYTRRLNEEKEQELDQLKLKFFINVSHEFRTPLTLILNPVEKILTHFNDPDEVKRSAAIIQKSSKRLLYLVDQLLDLRKMDLGKSHLEIANLDIVKFCRETFFLFEDLAKSKNIRFVFESEFNQYYGNFDADKIEKILANLLSNAIKFTDNGGVITLTLSEIFVDSIGYKWNYLRPSINRKMIQINVSDTGIGFKKKQLKEVFQRFFHADASKAGTGIGLNFTKSLVELHKGMILVESKYKQGTTFSVRLPADLKQDGKKIIEAATITAQGKNMNALSSADYEISIADENINSDVVASDADKKRPLVLLIEDNKVLRSHLKAELSEQFRVKEAVNGVAGLEKIRKYFPDIIISDVTMPKMDGFELCQQLKSDFEISHIPILLLTARSLDEDLAMGYERGADAYLSKPFSINVLKARVNNLLEARKRSRERFAAVGGIIPASDITINSLDEKFLDKATKAVVDNVTNVDFSLDDLLNALNMGRSQFYRKISSLTGQNPSNFIRTIKLKYAAELLISDSFSIKEVAHNCGFNSTAYFTKTFKEVFNVTPSQYIEENRTRKNEDKSID